MTQLELALGLPDEPLATRQLQAMLRTLMLCTELRQRISREQCLAYQVGEVTRTVGGAIRRRIHAPPICRSGTCKQGLEVLFAAGVLRWQACPACGGSGRVPAQRSCS